MKDELTIEQIEQILESSFNYDKIRIYAVNFFYRTNTITGISEKCKIIYNPFRAVLFDLSDEYGIEKYLDFELIDYDLDTSKAREYKFCFAASLQILYNQKQLITGNAN